MQNNYYLGMKFEDNIKPYSNLSRGKILALIQKELTPAQILYETKEKLIDILMNEKRNNFLERFKKLKNETIFEKKKEINKLLKLYSTISSDKKAIIGLQSALNTLNQNKKDSPVKEKNLLLEDGIFEIKTKATLNNVCENYNSRIIKKYILNAILSSIIFDTKNDKNTDTEKLIKNTLDKLKGSI